MGTNYLKMSRITRTKIYLLLFVAFCKAQPGQKAIEFCAKYGEAVYVEQDSPILSRRAMTERVTDCGIVSVPLIIGGVTAKEKEFPHMAVIGYGSSPDANLYWGCGGALISDLFIITAAHCLKSREYGNAQKVQLGTVELNSPDAVFAYVAERIAHPNYKKPVKYDDIGLLRLSEPVTFDAYVRPACINTLPFIQERRAIATGFGKLSYNDKDGSKSLMKVELDIINKGKCSSYYKGDIQIPNGLTDKILCAGELSGGRDTCQGDSGGPLQIVLRKPYCMYSIIGITSFGKFCGFANSPGIYTRISAYVPWIEQHVWP